MSLPFACTCHLANAASKRVMGMNSKYAKIRESRSRGRSKGVVLYAHELTLEPFLAGLAHFYALAPFRVQHLVGADAATRVGV